jgi:hypothetical protein
LNIPAQNFDKFYRADRRKSVVDQLHTVHQGRIEQIWCDRAKRFRELDQRGGIWSIESCRFSKMPIAVSTLSDRTMDLPSGSTS